MPQFTYKGKDKDGKAVTMTVDAADRYAVYDVARQNGHTVSSIGTSKRFSLERLINIEKINFALSRVKQDELVTMTRNLSSMLKAGLPLTRALAVIERQSKNPRMKGIMTAIQEDINKGNPFHDALKKFPKTFSDLYVAMVRAGEEGGQLTDALQTLGMQMERSSTLRKKIKGAMIYPAIVITVMGIIGVLMMIYVVPSITATFTKMEVELPTTTKILIATSDIMSHHSILILAGLAGAIFGITAFARTKVGKRVIHYIIVRLPVIGTIAKEVNAARTGRTLSSLLTAGVDVVSAIKITEDVVQNVYYKDVLRDASARVEKGTALSQVFIEREDLYPTLVGEMISVGEETGQISRMLEETATFYETEVDQKTKDLSTIIEPILMVVIGATVGFFALAMIAPIYSISDSIG